MSEGPRTRPPTQGQRAYAAYVAAVEGRPVTPGVLAAMWARLLPREQRIWEETAAAVLAELAGEPPQEERR
jgi:hypothetical protein